MQNTIGFMCALERVEIQESIISRSGKCYRRLVNFGTFTKNTAAPDQ